MLRRIILCDMRVAASCGVPLVWVAYLAVAAALYCFAGEGAWVFVPATEESFFGFFPDVVYAAAETGCPAESADVSACLAHAVLLPAACLASTALFARAVLGGGALRISAARGQAMMPWFASKTAVSWFFSVVPFVLATIGVAAFSEEGLLSVMPEVAKRLALAGMLILGLCALYWGVFIACDAGPASVGVVFVGGIAAFVVQMSLPSAFVPASYAMLARVAGIGLWRQSAFLICVSCIMMVIVAATIAMIGFARRMR